jgi:hypothetical protein
MVKTGASFTKDVADINLSDVDVKESLAGGGVSTFDVTTKLSP